MPAPAPGDGVRLALVAALGAWAGDALTDGARWGAIAGAAGAVLLVTTDAGARLLAQARELAPGIVPGWNVPPAVKSPSSSQPNVIPFVVDGHVEPVED